MPINVQEVGSSSSGLPSDYLTKSNGNRIIGRMSQSLAVPAKKLPEKSHESGSTALEPEIGMQEVRETAARLLAQGFPTKHVAKSLMHRLVPGSKYTGGEKLATAAYRKLRRWQHKDTAFRDLIYEYAVRELDLKAPLILNGVARSAQRGRVDAARLALEVTGRHTPNHETVVTNVTVQVANIPRPQ